MAPLGRSKNAGQAQRSTANYPVPIHPPSTDTRTSTWSALRELSADEPPSTPQTQRRRVDKGKGVLRTRPDTTNLRNPSQGHANPVAAPTVATVAQREANHSYGQSWSSTTRDSVVDNLLSSLDRIADPRSDYRAHNSDFASSAAFPASPQHPPLSRLNHRARAHTYSSSVSSDNDHPNPDDIANRYTHRHISHGRRSNSNSSVSAIPLHRSNSSAAKSGLVRKPSMDHQRFVRGGDSNRVLGKTIFRDEDLLRDTEVMDTKDGLGLTIGSIPLDDEYRIFTDADDGLPDKRSESAQGNLAESVLARGRPLGPLKASYGPMGSPVGSRSASDSVLPTTTSSNRLYAPGAQKSSNLRTGTSTSPRIDKVPSPRLLPQEIPKEIRDQATDFVRASSMRNLPHSPTVTQTSTTPSVSQQRFANSPAEGTRERQGFFKRVFGSSNSRTNLLSDPNSPASKRSPSQHRDESPAPRQNSMASSMHVVSQIRSESRSRLGEHAPPPNRAAPAPPQLNKKGSSFFRRRKKSVTDAGTPPALPPQLVTSHSNMVSASPSVNSLMQVMNPYLVDDSRDVSRQGSEMSMPASRMESRDDTPPSASEDTDDPDMFHSGYTPPPDASLRKFSQATNTTSSGSPNPARALSTPAAPSDLPLRGADGPISSSSARKMKIRKNKPQALEPNSFLADNSDADDLHRASSVVSSVSDRYVMAKTSPGSRRDQLSPASVITPTAVNSRGNRMDNDLLTPRDPFLPKFDRERASPDADSHDFVVTTLSRPSTSETSASAKSPRVWLESSPTPSEDDVDSAHLTLPLEGVRTLSALSPKEGDTPFHTPTTELPSVRLDVHGALTDKRSFSASTDGAAPDSSIGDDEMERARAIYDGDEHFIPKDQAAAWLGENTTVSTRTLKLYMELYNWSGQTILQAMRGMCGRLILKGETQQVDRILDTFARRWCECNPNHGFKGTDVVHTIVYSLILLNTDLHLADIESKMTRSQFVKNTLPTIKRVAEDAAAEGEETVRAPATASRPGVPWQNASGSAPASPRLPAAEGADDAGVHETQRPVMTKRMSLRPSLPRSDSDHWLTAESASSSSGSTGLVNQRIDGNARAWESELESILKSFFTAIKSEALPLNRARPSGYQPPNGPGGLSVNTSGLRRTGSIMSMTPSETASVRGRKTDFHSLSSRWTSKNRSRARLYAASTMGSSLTSFDDGGSLWSPATGTSSSMWSKYSIGKGTAGMSVDSLGVHNDGYQESIGFANALSQAIIREEGTGSIDDESFTKIADLLEDENLAFAGAPWAKEGIIKHKHHLEGPDKKAKERNWGECFAVIEKGWLRLFAFNTKQSNAKAASVVRNRIGRGKAASITPGVVGGGNWMQNAEQLGAFLLRQTIASTLPPPGYSKARPHVWALSLPSGAVHLFQVGTAEIAKEFMTTANYWSARLSKEPLSGGVSNVEYGWSDSIINPALIGSDHRDSIATGSISGLSQQPSRHGRQLSTSSGLGLPRPSMASSMRGSLDQGTSRPRLPGDKATLVDFQPPSQSMMASNLMEVDQLTALKDYVSNVEAELSKHNDLRGAVGLAFSPRHPNHGKAIANWEKKSAYLLREIVKFRTYVDCLISAGEARARYYAEIAERGAEREAREARKAERDAAAEKNCIVEGA